MGKIITLDLSNDEKNLIYQLINDNVVDYDSDFFDEFQKSCKGVLNSLPYRLLDWTDQVKKASIGLIRNLEIGNNIPPTPLARFCADNTSMFSDRLIGVISYLFGIPFTYTGKTVTRHITNLYPIKEHRNTQMASSDTELDWHVEDAFRTSRPDWISLLCLKGDNNAVIRIARAKDLQLSSEQFDFLREHEFEVLADDTYDDMTQTAKIKILTNDQSDPEIAFDPPYTLCRDDKENTVLLRVREAAEECKVNIRLRPGELVLFNNKKVIHSRSEYSPSYDGNDRWLKRTLILSDSKIISQLKKGVMY